MEKASYSPSLYFFNPPLDHAQQVMAGIIPPEAFPLLTSTLSPNLPPDHGLVVLTALDCLGNTAAGVSFAALGGDAFTKPYYNVGGLPTLTTQTDSSGIGGVLGVPAGVISVTATLADGRKVGTVSLLVRGSALSFCPLVPIGN
jgi:hypothetical protein